MTAPWPPGGPDQPVSLDVKVIPGARKNSLEWTGPLALKVRLCAPPVDGKANDALVAYLAESFGLRPRQVTLVRGLTGRQKSVKISPL